MDGHKTIRGWVVAVWSGAAGILAEPAKAQWTFTLSVASGEQCDVVRGPNERLHLVTSRYYQFDTNGLKLADEAFSGQDQAQGALDFNPGIAVHTGGTVHIVSRRNGSWGAGYDLWYSQRSPGGGWTGYKALAPEVRNYQVAIACADNGNVYLTHARSDGNVWGPVRFYRETGGAMTFLGDINNIVRIDCDQVIRARGDQLYLGSGKSDGSSYNYFARAAAAANPVSALSSAMKTHSDGGNRKGFPSVAIDAQANFHVAYGATSTVYYNKYNASNGKVFSSDKLVFSGLGWWGLHAGLSALAVSDDGQQVLLVALQPDETNKEASNSELLFAVSTNGGSAWSPPFSTGRFTTGGEGRCRPALVYAGRAFYLFYKDKAASGTSLGIFRIPEPVAAPAFSLPGGTYTGSVLVAVTCATAGASIHFTTNGEAPSTNAPLYTAPLLFTNGASVTVSAIAAKSGLLPSSPASGTYRVISPYEAWAEALIANPAARGETHDPDGDGHNNRSEFVADTHPTNRASFFRALALEVETAARISFLSSSARLYTLQYTLNLATGTWTDVAGQTSVRGSGGVTNLADPMAVRARIYRLRVAVPP